MRAASHLLAGLALASGALGRIKYLGVAIPGIDFGCAINGYCPTETQSFPLSGFGGGDGEGQMKHFVEDDGFNVFRLPITWQFALDGKLGGKLDAKKFGYYDKLMQACLDTGAYCMIDLHNFARFSLDGNAQGGVVGQGGEAHDQDLVDIWKQIATKYAKNDRIMYGLMNEPHDLDQALWAQTCQKVVTGIRNAGASQIILLPPTNFASAETFVSSGGAETLGNITNPDGTTDNLIFDLHKYLDINNSGTHEECTNDNVAAFRTAATWLRENKRTAIISETGASMDPSCMEKFCEQNRFLSQNADVFLGFLAWGAGSFDSSYLMTLTPSGSAGSYKDNKLVTQCIIEVFMGNTTSETSSATSATTATTVTSVASSTSTNQIFREETTTSSAPSETSTSSSKAKSSGCNLSVSPFVGGLMFAAMALCF